MVVNPITFNINQQRKKSIIRKSIGRKSIRRKSIRSSKKSKKSGGCNLYSADGICGCMLGGKRLSKTNKKRPTKK